MCVFCSILLFATLQYYCKLWEVTLQFTEYCWSIFGLIKMTPKDNFNNILWVAFFNKNLLRSFFRLYSLCFYFCELILAKKLIEIHWWNWHKVSISSTFKRSFYARKSRKHKKRLKTWLSFYAFGICSHKSWA